MQDRIDAEISRLNSVRLQPDHPLALAAAELSGQKVPAALSLADLLRRPHVHYELLEAHGMGAPRCARGWHGGVNGDGTCV